MLEEERQNLTSELKSLQAGRTDSERGRKRAESQLQELNARLTQADREREEREERLHKLQVRIDTSTLKLLLLNFEFSHCLGVFNLTEAGLCSAIFKTYSLSLSV